MEVDASRRRRRSEVEVLAQEGAAVVERAPIPRRRVRALDVGVSLRRRRKESRNKIIMIYQPYPTGRLRSSPPLNSLHVDRSSLLESLATYGTAVPTVPTQATVVL